jgi:hypothetical protein
MSNPGVSSSVSANTQAIINGMQLLWILRGAQLNVAGDQLFIKYFNGITWDPYFIVANYVSGAFSGTCTGGVYSAPNKGGSQIVPSGQSYGPLTGPLTHQNIAITSSTVTFVGAPYLNMTTPNPIALVCDYFIFGFVYD